MNARPLLVASALFVSLTAFADDPATPPVDACRVATNTKGPPQNPCPESTVADAPAPADKADATTEANSSVRAATAPKPS